MTRIQFIAALLAGHHTADFMILAFDLSGSKSGTDIGRKLRQDQEII